MEKPSTLVVLELYRTHTSSIPPRSLSEHLRHHVVMTISVAAAGYGSQSAITFNLDNG